MTNTNNPAYSQHSVKVLVQVADCDPVEVGVTAVSATQQPAVGRISVGLVQTVASAALDFQERA